MSGIFLQEKQKFNIVIGKDTEVPTIQNIQKPHNEHQRYIRVLVSPWKTKQEIAAFKKDQVDGVEHKDNSPPFYITAFNQNADILSVLVKRRDDKGRLSSFTADGFLKNSVYEKDGKTKYKLQLVLLDIRELIPNQTTATDSQSSAAISNDDTATEQ